MYLLAYYKYKDEFSHMDLNRLVENINWAMVVSYVDMSYPIEFFYKYKSNKSE